MYGVTLVYLGRELIFKFNLAQSLQFPTMVRWEGSFRGAQLHLIFRAQFMFENLNYPAI